MEPKKCWFVDDSPFPRSIFRFHLSFRWCKQNIPFKNTSGSCVGMLDVLLKVGKQFIQSPFFSCLADNQPTNQPTTSNPLSSVLWQLLNAREHFVMQFGH